MSDPELEAFLDEALPPERMEQVEVALRRDAALAERIATILGRRDAGLHTLGAIWRRHRLSCLSREQLGSYLLGVLPNDEADYARFHLEEIACRVCQASLADLREQHAAAETEAVETRRRKYFQSSAGYLQQ